MWGRRKLPYSEGDGGEEILSLGGVCNEVIEAQGHRTNPASLPAPECMIFKPGHSYFSKWRH